MLFHQPNIIFIKINLKIYFLILISGIFFIIIIIIIEITLYNSVFGYRSYINLILNNKLLNNSDIKLKNNYVNLYKYSYFNINSNGFKKYDEDNNFYSSTNIYNEIKKMYNSILFNKIKIRSSILYFYYYLFINFNNNNNKYDYTDSIIMKRDLLQEKKLNNYTDFPKNISKNYLKKNNSTKKYHLRHYPTFDDLTKVDDNYLFFNSTNEIS